MEVKEKKKIRDLKKAKTNKFIAHLYTCTQPTSIDQYFLGFWTHALGVWVEIQSLPSSGA